MHPPLEMLELGGGYVAGSMTFPNLWSNYFKEKMQENEAFLPFFLHPRTKLETENSQLAPQAQRDPSSDIYWWRVLSRRSYVLLSTHHLPVQICLKLSLEQPSLFCNCCTHNSGGNFYIVSASILPSESFIIYIVCVGRIR